MLLEAKSKSVAKETADQAAFKPPVVASETVAESAFKKPPVVIAAPESVAKPSQAKRRSSAMSQRPPAVQPKTKPIAESQRPRTQAKAAKKNDKGETKLHLAVMSNDIEAVKELLRDENADVNVKDFAGWTGLHEACMSGNVEMINTLIEFGADVNSLGCQNNTPMHEAALNNQIESIRILLDHGASAKIRNTFGVLPIELAKDKQVLKLFAEYEEKMAINRSADDQEGDEAISRSQFDTSQSLDMSISRTSSSRRSVGGKTAKKVLLYPTAMSEEDKVKFMALASQLSVKVSKEMNQNGKNPSVVL